MLNSYQNRNSDPSTKERKQIQNQREIKGVEQNWLQLNESNYDIDSDYQQSSCEYIHQIKVQRKNKLAQKIKEFNQKTDSIICYEDIITEVSSLLNQIIDLRSRLPKFELQYNQSIQIIKLIDQNKNQNVYDALKQLKLARKNSQWQVYQWEQNYLRYIAERHFKILKKIKNNNQKRVFPKFFRIQLQNIQKGNLIKINVQKYLKLPIFYDRKNVQVTCEFYQNLNVKNQKKFVRDISQTINQLKNLGISNNDIRVSNIIYSVRDNRFKIIDFDRAVFCKGQSKNENNYTVIQNLDFQKLQSIKNKSINNEQISQDQINEAILLNYSFQMKINIFTLEDIRFINNRFQNFRLFMQKNNGKFDLLMFAYLLISLFKNSKLSISEYQLIKQIKNPILFSDLNRLNSLKRKFIPTIKPLLVSIFKVLRLNLSTQDDFNFYQAIKQDLEKSKYSSSQELLQNYKPHSNRIIDPYERFLNRLLQQISILQRTHVGQDSFSSSCSSIQHLLSDYDIQSSRDQVLIELTTQIQSSTSEVSQDDRIVLFQDKKIMNYNKILDYTLNLEEINEFVFLLKIFDLFEKLFTKWYLVVNNKNKKKIDILEWKNYIQIQKEQKICQFIKKINFSNTQKQKNINWTYYFKYFWKTKYYFKKFIDQNYVKIQVEVQNKNQEKKQFNNKYQKIIKCCQQSPLSCQEKKNLNDIFLAQKKAKRYWSCRFLLEKNRYFQLRQQSFMFKISENGKYNKQSKNNLPLKKLQNKCKKVKQLFKEFQTDP